MSLRFLFLAFCLIALSTVIACASPTAAPAPAAAPVIAASSSASSAPVPTRMVAASSAASSSAASSIASGVSPSSAPSINPSALNTQRKIVKNAQLQLTVESTDVALDRLTGITTDMGGYILSTRVFTEGGLKAATISFAVPVDQFESTMRRVRAVALKVEQESSSGQDVTDQYVDLESQVKNLEATANRIRDFLTKAQTVEEALKVNQQLSDVEKQIETLKGKMNQIDGRSAFSTITAELREPKPTPVPAPTMTPTPTPTPTPLPVGWNPTDTLDKAVGAQKSLLKVFIDLAIWLVVVPLPYAIVIGAIAWLVLRIQKSMQRKMPSDIRSENKPPDTM
ncbi:MAG: DUF4349 domain-containing protein [Chloroflexi bacterium]|nr:DUF4349 domain-containing protein [Chloroflexota bacterium]